MDRFHRALLVAGLFLLAMTRSDDKSESQERRRWRIPSFRRGGTAMRARSEGVVIKCE